jgi:sugar/nucleoside kinase (ribokinase family)
MDKSFDCVVCGSCTVDVLVRPFPLNRAPGSGQLLRVDPILATTGGIVCNSSVALARLGMRAAGFTYLGDDDWALLVRRRLQAENVDASRILTHPSLPTSVSVVLVAADGERSFVHSQGAPKGLDRAAYLDHLDLFARSRMMLLGYYPLMPRLEPDLPEVLSRIRATGCRTALDAAGDGGALHPLDHILPHLDVYCPSYAEAAHQTGQTDPQRMLQTFRDGGAPGLLGVKLGSRGALLSPDRDTFLAINPVSPPGPVVDTTGAGDAFYAGLLAGLLRGLPVEQAGRLAAATGACCVTAPGATAGLKDFAQTAALAQM